MDNPILDHRYDDASLPLALTQHKGSIQQMDHSKIIPMIKGLSTTSVVSSGLALTTIKTLTSLIGPDAITLGIPAFSGAIGQDPMGKKITSELSQLGISFDIREKQAPTSVMASFISPTFETTQFVYHGAAHDFTKKDINYDFLKRSHFFFSTSSFWAVENQKKALFEVIPYANELNIPVCFKLLRGNTLSNNADEIAKWIKGKVDYLFTDKETLSIITKKTSSNSDLLESARHLAPTIIMNLGKNGAMIYSEGTIIHVQENVIATTIDIDAYFTAGFLYGLLNKRGLSWCAKLGINLARTHTISKVSSLLKNV